MGKELNLTLHVWRQSGAGQTGKFETYEAKQVSEHASFLEMLDQVNEELIQDEQDPIVFDHDCREGICGTCGFVINGEAHGPQRATTVCQLHMRQFEDGDELWLEPFRAEAFPIVKDLMVDRSAFDRIIQAGGYVSVGTGGAPDANAIAVPKRDADLAMDAAACIGCGACVAACPNAAAMLFASAKVAHLNVLPQGQAEADERTRKVVAQMEAEGFGHCTNHFECSEACPKEISVDFIARLNREFLTGALVSTERLRSRKR
jgi:succinate dehydrogenase / fumarate reductase iron-sulfur subunit